MKSIIPFIITAGVIAGFIWLAHYSLSVTQKKHAAYDIQGMNMLVAASQPLSPRERLRRDQAKALATVYHLSASDIAQPLNIFGEDQ